MWESLYDFVFGSEDKLLRVNDWYHITKEDIDAYIAQGAKVKCKRDDGWNVLMQAALCGAKPGTLRYLVELGVDPDEINNYGLKAWNYAKNETCANVLRRMTRKELRRLLSYDMKPLGYDGYIRS